MSHTERHGHASWHSNRRTKRGGPFAPLWGWISDRTSGYRFIFFGGFLLLHQDEHHLRPL
jgi:hypothetical protein